MNKEVYKHILATYGKNVGQWVGLVAEIIRLLIMRVYIVIPMARVTSSIASGDLYQAKRNTLYFLIAYVTGSIIGSFGEILSTDTENVQYNKSRLYFYQKLLGKDLSFYRDHQTGYLVSIFRQYIDGMMNLVRLLRGEALGTLISLIIPPILLYFVSPRVGLVAIAVVLVQFMYVKWSSKRANKYRQLTQEAYRRLTGEVSDQITNIVAFKSGGMNKDSQGKMVSLMEAESNAFKIRRRTTELLDLPRNIITAFGIAFAIFEIITHNYSAGPEALGLMVLTITFMFQIVRNVAALPSLITTHDDLINQIYPNLKHLSNDHESIRDIEHPKALIIPQGSILIQNVSFSYPSKSDTGVRIRIFENLNIHIKGGERVGIVGLSGAGKSTLANLLLRFDDIESGLISIDNIDIREVEQNELRRQIAYVPQEPLLFHRSIYENIAYYNPSATAEDIMHAAQAAHAHEFIGKLPEGYNTTVGERGIKLSGGQKQRIAIARAILKKAPIMIFDEATSALDSESEQIIQRALPDILGKQTAIVVAHRLSTVAILDRILVMHDGKVVEEGNHEQLLLLKGKYYSLWQKQTTEFATLLPN